MTVLVTGAGAVGRLTAAQLAARGDAVIMADVREPDEPPGAGIGFARCDVTDREALERLVAQRAVSRIVHTAAMLSTGIREDPVRGVAVNVMGTMHVLEAARRHGVRRVVVSSSTSIGYTTFARDRGTAVTEDLDMRLVSERPAGVYVATKVAAEHLALLYHDLYGLDVVCLRYAAVLGGDGGRPTSVPGRLLALLVDGARSGRRIALDDPFMVWGGQEEFVDARDCARANVAALDATAPVQRVYNVSPGVTVDLPGFIAAVRRVHPALEADPGPARDTGFAGFPHRRPAPSSTEAARRELGFACRHDLEDTVRHWTT